MARPKKATKTAVECGKENPDFVIEKEYLAPEADPRWTPIRQDRNALVEDLTRDILLRRIEHKGGQTFAADVGYCRQIAEAYADEFGY